MADTLTVLAVGGGVPEVEIVIGQAQFGTYEIYLWDSDGTSPRLIGKGLNTDSLPDVHPIGPAAALGGKKMTWQCVVSAPKKSPGQKYSVTVIVRQDGNVCENSPYQQTGSLSGGTRIVHDYTEFKVQ